MERRIGLTQRHLRALRGSASAAVATLIAATSHTLGGGGAPPAWLLLTVAVLAAPLAVWIVGRAPSLWRTAVVVVASQALFHTTFILLGNAQLRPAEHIHGLPTLAGATPHVHNLGAPMIVAHLLAAVVTVILVAHGERMLRSVARGIRHLLGRIDVPVSLAVFPHIPPRGGVWHPTGHRFQTAFSLRGPPALFC